jgi:predicted Zn-dependent protease
MSGLSRTAQTLPILAMFVAIAAAAPVARSQQAPSSPAAPVSAAVAADPILKAMREELDRSRSLLKMENLAAPYYIEYRVADVHEYDLEAAFGAIREKQNVHARSLRVVVRVGDYKLDSYSGPGEGVTDFAPLDDDDPIALRRNLWLATDAAYKRATEALAGKKASLAQYAAGQPFDDFAKAPPLESIGPIVKMDPSMDSWAAALEKATNLYRTNLKIQSLRGELRFRVVNQYYVNTEGSTTRQGYPFYSVQLDAESQAGDGMKLGRTPSYVESSESELPTPETLLANAAKALGSLQQLLDAPIVEEDYRGPVLFSADASSDIFNSLIGDNVLGIRPRIGDSSRAIGDFAASYKNRVLPTFLTVFDDPTMKTFGGKPLIGSYEIDEEGVRAQAVPLIQDGKLTNYLMSRMPIRDIPDSNGHGRAGPGQAPLPTIGVLLVKPKDPVSPEDLKKRLIELCKTQDKPYGYYVETMSGLNPRLLYRVYVNDGRQELVRGAIFDDLDTRALRNNLVAAGNDPLVSNREGYIPTTIISPSILFDELELKRTDQKDAKLPEYPAPALVAH